MRVTISPLKGDNIDLTENSDRGFRFEAYLNVANGKGIYQHNGTDALRALESEYQKFKSDHPTLVQVYFYLTDYKEKPLDKQAFEHMERYMSKLKELNLKALLRFAYVWDDGNPKTQEPSEEQIMEHLSQLSSYIEKWEDQIHVLQAGIIGAWGEWSFKARERYNEARILKKILESTPEKMKVQVRYWDIKQKSMNRYEAARQRVGYHDDFLIGEYHRWNTAGAERDSVANEALREDSREQLVDGEMIWWWANPIYLNERTIAADKMAERLTSGHFTSFSLTHNYKDMIDGDFSKAVWKNELRRNNKNTEDYLSLSETEYPTFSSISAWKTEALLLDDLLRLNYPYDPAWFLNEQDQAIDRNWYEYFRDFLGYRMSCETLLLDKSLNGTKVMIDLINRGFAAPIGLEKFVLMIYEGDRLVKEVSYTDLASFQPMKSVSLQVDLTEVLEPADVSIGLKLTSKDQTGNRLANDVLFEDQVNWLLKAEDN